jgi:uncharacterized protein
MTTQMLISNLTNPTILFFALGIFAVLIKSDLEIPGPSIKFISLYLLFSIGFKGGQELAHSAFDMRLVYALVFGLAVAAIIPTYIFFILKTRVPVADAGAIAATYGSVSAVTFVSAISFLELMQITYSGYMVAVMALMEAPAIIMGVLLIEVFDNNSVRKKPKIFPVIKHAFSNGSVIIIMGSLIIGLISDSKQAEGIKPFTTDIFKGFLAIFLLDLGMLTARRFTTFKNSGFYLGTLAILFPVINGSVVAFATHTFLPEAGDRFLMALLAASASYIAVPAALKIAVPKADPGMYIPMALGVTFPFNITLGIPLYYLIAQ